MVRKRSAAVKWFLWGALMGLGLLGIFSIGIPIIIVGLVILAPLIADGRGGAWMALAGAATPWVVFSLEGYLSPDCADGIATISPNGRETFTCHSMHASSEFVPFLIVAVALFALGSASFLRSRRREAQGASL